MIRFCPNCKSERPLTEMFCEGMVDGRQCGWDLSAVPVRPEGWRPGPVTVTHTPATAARCVNGHEVAPGDLLCPECSADIETPSRTPMGDITENAGPPEVTVIDGWRLELKLATNKVGERYAVVREADRHEAILTLYADGSEPDTEVYDVLRELDRDHVPEILTTGRWRDRAYEVSEDLKGGTLSDLGLLPDDVDTLRRVVAEIGGALAAFAERGLRHRDLTPQAILIRECKPLDLVVSGFGSARLSDFDLDIVSPLEITRYTAPEAVAGGVAAASDWWGLGMLLLEQVTRGACFAGADDQAFLISVLTNGAPIPDGLVPEIDLLLRGLLARDRRERWGWPEVCRWLDGDPPALPASSAPPDGRESSRTIALGGRRHGNMARLALAAAQPEAWDEARELFLRGELLTWMEETGVNAALRADVRRIGALVDTSDDIMLAAVLKAMNPSMPLVVRGEIVTPSWLLDHPEEGYALIAGPVPALLEEKDSELWLARLQRRAEKVRERAKQLDVSLDEERLRVNVLSTSRSRLAAVWDERRRVLPDTDHPGLLAILERRITAEEDYILLLSADVGNFRAADVIVEEAKAAAQRAGLASFDTAVAHAWLARPRRNLNAAIDERVGGFARCGRDRIDEWADQFRVERRLPIARALALIAVAQEEWREPPKQSYLAVLLEFYARRITAAAMRGPLTRMVIGKTARIDLSELDSIRQRSSALLDHLLLRNDQTIEIDPAPLVADPGLERRLRTLHTHSTLYRRDSGIDGLYLGFPFLLMQEAKTTTKPRIAPVLLWPIKLHPETGARGRVTLAFDRDREEVRLNPAFETLLGAEAAQRWRVAAKEVLGRSTVNASEVVEALRGFARIDEGGLRPIPSKDAKVRVGEDSIVCAAALFHLAYVGQAVMEDLRQLKSVPPAGSSLETALRMGDDVRRAQFNLPSEIERYFTSDSDPSQEAAVIETRSGKGLLIEGPPGTGKSQTIVNIVADAIGTGRSLLIVCQKQAALEVVYKRLTAAGLGDRIVMVNDVNRDREPVIRAIREQVEEIWRRPGGAMGWKQQRAQTASKIEALERSLDEQHTAHYAVDERTGLSYRLILSDLIALADQGPPAPSVFALRQLLRQLNPGEVAILQETCAPVARLWLPAHYEGSALAVTRLFGADEGTIAAFEADFAQFAVTERERLAVVEQTPEAFAIDDAGPYQDWTMAHGRALCSVDPERRQRLARWLDRLAGVQNRGRATTAIHLELADIARGLLALPPDDVDDGALAVALAMDDVELEAWTRLSDRLLAKPGFLGRMSLGRWLARRRRSRFLKSVGLADVTAFGGALHREAKVRQLRKRLAAALADVGEPFGDLGAMRVSELLAATRSVLAEFSAVEELVERLEAYPEKARAFETARAASTQAVGEFFEGINQGLARHAVRIASALALDRLKSWMVDEWIADRMAAIRSNLPNTAAISTFQAASPTLPAYQRFRVRVAGLGSGAMKVLATLAQIRTALGGLADAELEPTVRRILATEARLAWKARLEEENPALVLEAAEVDAKASSLAMADREMRALNRKLLVEGIDPRDLRPLQEWEEITRLRGARARRLREFIDRGADLGLMALRPVWLVNPDVASRLLPLKKAMFDAVIYDEASQIPVEHALPTLFRGRTMIVSGDEKQMPPTGFFTSRVESDEAEVFEGQEAEEGAEEGDREAIAETWNRREIKDCPDLLQLAKTVIPSTTLQIHYRSVYRELIQFSNASFYSNRLSVPARHPADEIRRVRPIEVVSADGIYEAQTNEIEAQRVIETLADIWVTRSETRPTVGVVTFNRRQADLIEDLIEERAERDPRFRERLSHERDRVEGGENMGFFVKNVENVQGDERDIIIFSSTFGRNAQGTFRRAFGVLGQTGGERRLNVAVTRAREKVILITSMPIPLISDLLSTRRQAASPRDYLQAYFEYARAVSAGELDAAQALLARLTPGQQRGNGGSADIDGFQASVAAEIRKLGWEPFHAHDDGAFGLDFAIEDPRTGLYGIGIECDAPRHPLLANARAREMWRPTVLRRSIPAIHRVSSHRWHSEPALERARLRDAVREAMGETA